MSRWTDKADIFTAAYVRLFAALPTKQTVLFSLAVAEWETGCGDRLHGNWGGTISGQVNESDLQTLRVAGLSPANKADIAKAQTLLTPPANAILGTDTSAQSGWYWIWWYHPATPVEGAIYFVRVLLQQRQSCRIAMDDVDGSLDALARAMYATHYFLGLFNPHEAAVTYNRKVMSGDEANIESYRDHLLMLEPGIVAGLASWQPGSPPFDLDTPLGVQMALTLLAYSPGPLDGKDGPQTEAAIRSFQSAVGLSADGVVGLSTQKALENAIATRA